MIQQLFAALGVGSATVETTLTTPVVMPGDYVSGTTLIQGGTVDQRVEVLSLFVMAEIDVEVGDQKVRRTLPLASAPLAEQMTIKAGSRTELNFRFQLHPETPITDLSRSPLPANDPARSVKATGRQNAARIWFHTGLDIDRGVDSSDRDPLFVRPTGPQLVMLRALERMGMILIKADVELGTKRAARSGTTIGCFQEFEYRPPLWRYGGLEEVEVTFVPRSRETRVIFELDRRRRRDTARVLTMDHSTFDQVDWAAEVDRLLRS